MKAQYLCILTFIDQFPATVTKPFRFIPMQSQVSVPFYFADIIVDGQLIKLSTLFGHIDALTKINRSFVNIFKVVSQKQTSFFLGCFQK